MSTSLLRLTLPTGVQHRRQMLTLLLIITFAILSLQAAFSAQAQAGLDYHLPPDSGTISLHADFLPDPRSVSITSGGPIDASYLGGDCQGYAISAPDFRVRWSGASSYLRFYVESFGDTTLIINDPYGNWYCNDDYNGLDPQISFSYPAEGVYDIWVGSYSSDDYMRSTLNISELPDVVEITSLSATVSGASSLRARYGPGVNYSAVSSANGGVLFEGQWVTLVGRAPHQSGSSIWVELADHIWVNSRYLSVNGNVEYLPYTWNG